MVDVVKVIKVTNIDEKLKQKNGKVIFRSKKKEGYEPEKLLNAQISGHSAIILNGENYKKKLFLYKLHLFWLSVKN